MLSTPFKCYGHMKRINPHGVLAIGNNNLGHIVFGLQSRNYSKDKESCCKDIAQTAGKKVEPWPKPDPPPPAWRSECPKEPQPPNYDPYRIKVPDVVVPPLPPSNAKEIPQEDERELFKNTEADFGPVLNSEPVQDLFYNTQIIHPDYWRAKKDSKLPEVVHKVLPKLGYHGRIKYKYAFHKPWKPLDRMGLLEQAEKEEIEIEEMSSAEKNNKQLQ